MSDAPNEDELLEAPAALRSVASIDDEATIETSVVTILRRARPELARRRREAARPNASKPRRRSPVVVAAVLAAVFGAGVIGGMAFERTRRGRFAETIRPDVAHRGRATRGPAAAGEAGEESRERSDPGPLRKGFLHGEGVSGLLAPDTVELLELSAEQHAELDRALRRHARVMEEIERDAEPEIRKADAELEGELGKILDDVQRDRFEIIRRVMPARTREPGPR